MKSVRTWIGAVLFAALVGGMLAPALMVRASSTITSGTVVALDGTLHLWIADSQGALHWGGDTRALAGRQINWSDRVEVSLAQLQGLERGDPWLSAGLLKDGDPIYLVKWETEWDEPRLFHIQSIADVELFGIDTDNYGDFVLDPSAWETEYGFSVDDLETSTLPPATPLSDSGAQDGQTAVISGQSRQDDDDDDDDGDDDTATATATDTATATGDQTATATATATDDGTSVTHTATDDTGDGQPTATQTATQTATATATDTATATGDQTATATATATDDGTSVTQTATNDTPDDGSDNGSDDDDDSD